jgi:lipopolysaccharide/colanic/teichoic acid biosynthesis glycosyltransferase
MKRFLDTLAALFTLAVTWPLLVFGAVAVWADSGRPVFFRQERVGLGGRVFHMVKFRTMVVNAAAIGPHSTADGDPRITRVGGWMRRASLDELPQVWNVLCGHMSIVGPRPDVPAQRSGYTAAQWAERHRVRPGITGLAQALYRSSATPEQRLEADLRYARDASLALDLKIVWWTLARLAGRGAN